MFLQKLSDDIVKNVNPHSTLLTKDELFVNY